MSACELTVYITAIANTMAGNLSEDELGLWGAIFSQLGDTLETIAVQRSICNKNTSS